MKHFTAEEILDGIRDKNNDILTFVYKEYYPFIKKYILNNNGNKQDAEDIFQETIVMIYRKVEEGQLSLDCSLKTYIYSVCRILWLKELETRKLIRNNDPELKNIVDPEVNFYLENGDLEKKKLIQEHLMHLKENCRQILTLFYAGVPSDEITEILGMSSTANTRQKKNRCKEKLIKSIKKDPRFRNSGISE
ncbi:unnamed protein product [marine sediment metagenome]|uniref:RNA polymerase sigma-70 region 2 domain-containing protein n=1 Tax=marine sediment metagenome TaxID=412755 RepID=X1QWX9_9ZZZZ